MAATVTEVWHGRTGTLELAKYHRTYEKHFRVDMDSILSGPAAVRAVIGIPRLLDPYFDDTGILDNGARVVKIDPEVDQDEPRLWMVKVYYDTELPLPSEQEQNPLDRPAEISWDMNKYQKAIERDSYDTPLLNSAGDPYDPPAEIDDSRPVLTIARNEAVYNMQLGILYQDAVNSDTFFGFEPGKVKLNKISAQSAFEQNLLFWKVRYEFEFRHEGWGLAILDRGYQKVDITTNVKTTIRDINGQPRSTASLLDGFGQVLDLATDDPVYFDYKPYLELPFAPLGLP